MSLYDEFSIPEVFQEKLDACQTIIGFTFSNPCLLMEALNFAEATYSFGNTAVHVHSNHRLALLGKAASEFDFCLSWLKSRHFLRKYISFALPPEHISLKLVANT